MDEVNVEFEKLGALCVGMRAFRSRLDENGKRSFQTSSSRQELGTEENASAKVGKLERAP